MKGVPFRKDLLHSTIDYKKLIELQGNSYYGDIKSNHQKVQNKMKVKRKISKMPQIPRK